jgi:hypothetical protein
METKSFKLTLDRITTYKICVPCVVDTDLGEFENYPITREGISQNGQMMTLFTCSVDQAGLHSILRLLYSTGHPLISVWCVEFEKDWKIE